METIVKNALEEIIKIAANAMEPKLVGQTCLDEILAIAKKAISDSEITDVEFEDAATEQAAVPEPTDASPYVIDWPNSSNVARTEYDRKERVLIVTFKGNGKRYAYHDFLQKDWDKIRKLLPDGSIGKYINSEVKGVHASTLLDSYSPGAGKTTSAVNASDL